MWKERTNHTTEALRKEKKSSIQDVVGGYPTGLSE